MQTEHMIFVVDDDEAVRDSLKVSLEAAGHVVETYSSGVDFLDAVIAGRRGCLVLDLHMPDLNGIEVLKALQRDRKQRATGCGTLHRTRDQPRAPHVPAPCDCNGLCPGRRLDS